MSTQELGITGDGPIRDRETGHVINVDITIGAQRTITFHASDSYTAATKTWVLGNGAFTSADVGATIVVTGSTSSNGTFAIASVTNATTIVTTTGPVGNENPLNAATSVALTDVPAPVTYIQELCEIDAWSIQLTNPDGNLTATIKIALCNDYMPHPETPQNEATAVRAGTWVEWTARYVGHPDATPLFPPATGHSQIITGVADFEVERFLFARVTITPTLVPASTAHLDGYVSGKSLA